MSETHAVEPEVGLTFDEYVAQLPQFRRWAHLLLVVLLILSLAALVVALVYAIYTTFTWQARAGA